MARGTDAGALANFGSQSVEAFPLVEMQLATGTLYLAGTPFDVPWNGQTWLATYGLGSIEAITESASEAAGCAFTLSGIPSSMVSQVLTENVRGKPVTVRLASISAGALSVDANVWQGYLDTMSIADGAESAVVRVTAEHRLVSWQSPHPVNFAHAEQILIAPTDTFYSRTADMAQKTVVWPSLEFFKK